VGGPRGRGGPSLPRPGLPVLASSGVLNVLASSRSSTASPPGRDGAWRAGIEEPSLTGRPAQRDVRATPQTSSSLLALLSWCARSMLRRPCTALVSHPGLADAVAPTVRFAFRREVINHSAAVRVPSRASGNVGRAPGPHGSGHPPPEFPGAVDKRSPVNADGQNVKATGFDRCKDLLNRPALNS